MERTLPYWIWLSEVCGADSPLPTLLFSYVGTDPEQLYRMERSDYEALGVLKDSQITALCDKDLTRPNRIIEACARRSIGILTLDDPFYPSRLRQIQQPPIVLYYRGFLPDFDRRLSIAVVGTRGMTEEGRVCAYRFAYEMAIAGTVIVSGMALGIDGIAQVAALDANGASVAILGTAIDRCYPQEHQPLYDRLLKSGCLISEYAPGTDTHPWHFPQRNRIISGLCQGTLVAEAGRKSGALITAQTANAQGRMLFAVPGDPGVGARVGTNDLIKSGAIPVTHSMDVLTRFASLYDTSVFPGNIGNPAYYRGYDDTLKYGKERVEKRRQEQAAVGYAQSERRRDPQNNPPPPDRTAPDYIEPREEPLDAHVPDEPREEPTPARLSPELRQKLTTANELPAPQPKAPLPDSKTESAKAAAADVPVSALRQKLLSLIAAHRSFDEMCTDGLTASDIMSELTLMEIDGCIVSTPGGQYEIQ